jgi:hypothetical protein
MRTGYWAIAGVALGLLWVLASGCGTGQPARCPVRGTVYYRGAVLSRGTIVFTPDASRGGEGELAHGEIQPDGSYRLRTEAGDGVPPGWYRVTVLSVEAPASVPAGQRYGIPRALLPARYRDPDLSDLVREVQAGRVNEIDFHLE